MKEKLKFIDLFAGIGGFHLAFHDLGAECVFASEIDAHARVTYETNFKKISPRLFKKNLFNRDITTIDDPSYQIPDFDVLCAGFPCQPFSQAGFKRGFEEAKGDRGNMFFHLANIIAAKRPKAIFLENVRHLVKHDDGRTFETIKDILTNQLDYVVQWKIVHASDHGLPQHRPRVFIVGFRKEDVYTKPFCFPDVEPLCLTMSDIFGGECPKKIGYTLRVGGRGSGLHDRRNWDHYLVNGEDYKLKPEQGKQMMGFPKSFVLPVSETQAMKQLGNSVAVNAVRATAKEIIKCLKSEISEEKLDSHMNVSESRCELRVAV
ncbi:MAG: DNA cytosine methyltransferase [Alphaproteobacteria bacterium CG_4_10_14_0_8_um_filter_53_9]|nr:MAG: DNA cytosine methyltransferase [Alphaproteobacteria bacterium CG_4_10_14_0_8_um_filter_53_9]